MEERRPRIPPYLLPLLLGIATLAVLYGRFWFQARGAIHAAEIALARDDRPEATRCYLDALRAYVPGSPYVRTALDGLEAIATAARTAGDPSGERQAWQAVRTGLLSTRSLYLPYPSRFAAANRHLTELNLLHPFPPGSPELAALAVVSMRGNGPGRGFRPLGPAVAATLMAISGMAIWVAAIVLLIRRGVQPTALGNRRRSRSTTSPASSPPITSSRSSRPRSMAEQLVLPALFVVGFALFLLGLRSG